MDYHRDMNARGYIAQVLFEDSLPAYLRLREMAESKGIRLASIVNLYRAISRGEVEAIFTVPAVNLRGMTYHMARHLIRQAKELKAFWVFEIARSEMGYTGQYPMEYGAEILGAAIDEGWEGPLFLQGDHFQLGTQADLDKVKILISEAVQAGFYNLDIDGSTLVDLNKPTVKQQQQKNIDVTRQLFEYIRTQDGGDKISVGGEIGHIGEKNSTKEEIEVFLEGMTKDTDLKLSKISVQTGTRHGGEVDSRGENMPMRVDWSVIDECTPIARKYQAGGVVQHGASTLPNAMLSEFPRHKTLEIHLATEWQNIVLDHPMFPASLRKMMERWVLENFGEKYESKEQCLYRERKQSWGKFQRQVWEIDQKNIDEIGESVQAKARLILENLGMTGKRKIMEKYAL